MQQRNPGLQGGRQDKLERSPSRCKRQLGRTREGGRRPEHEIVQSVREALGGGCFNNHFVNILGHRFIRNPTLDKICEILSRRGSDGRVTYSVESLNPQNFAPSDHERAYTPGGSSTVADQIHFLTPRPRKGKDPIHPRLCYQIVYE